MADNLNPSSPLPDVFSPATRDWFLRAFKQPTAVQSQTWHVAARSEHALVIAPTGSGKTLAAFLYALDQLFREGGEDTREAAKIPARRISVKPHASSIFHRSKLWAPTFSATCRSRYRVLPMNGGGAAKRKSIFPWGSVLAIRLHRNAANSPVIRRIF